MRWVILDVHRTPVKYLMDAPHMVGARPHSRLYVFALMLGVGRWWDWRCVPAGFIAASIVVV